MRTDTGPTIVVTGAAGLLGSHLVDALAARPDVHHIIAVDRRVPASTSPKVDARVVDVRDPGFGELCRDADALVHCAFLVDHPGDEQEMREVNVDGSRNVLGCAAKAGVRRIVHLSSAAVYGAHPDNPVPLREDAPLRVNPDVPYAAHKAEIEAWLWDQAASDPGLRVAALRPATISGPGVDNAVTWLLESPRLLTVKGHHPPMQFVHVDDVVGAIVHLLDHPELTGAFNCAAEGWLSFDEFAAVADLRTLDLGVEAAWQLADRAWRLGLAPSPPGHLHLLMHPWVVDVDKLVSAGWRPRHSNRDALDQMVAERRGRLALGPVRMPRWAPAAAGAGAAALALGTLVALRRRR